MNAPPLPFDQFPPIVRILGRPLLGELWQGCFQSGYDAGIEIGLAKGLAIGILGSVCFFLVAFAIGLATYLAIRARACDFER